MAAEATVVVSGAASDPDVDVERAARVSHFMERARSRYRFVVNAEHQLRQAQYNDLRFHAGEQWPPELKNQRKQDGRVCLTIPRIQAFIRQVTNAMRAAKPEIKVSPVEDADVKTAEIYQGIIRHIEQQSDAATAYSTAIGHQASIGRGYWRVVAEFGDAKSFDLELKIVRVRNPFSVYLDPARLDPSGSDARFGMITEDIPRPDYVDRYGAEKLASLSAWMSVGDSSAQEWMPEGKVRLAEYWFVDEVETRLLLVQGPDGADVTMTEDEFAEFTSELQSRQLFGQASDDDPLAGTGFAVVNERVVRERQVKWALLDGEKILEGNDDLTDGAPWPGQWIPIVCVVGEETDIDGVVDYKGMIRDAKDSARAYDFWTTSLTEAIALAPLTPWIVEANQVANYQRFWELANRKTLAYLPYDAKSVDGHLIPPPQRNFGEPPGIRATVMAIQQSDSDLKAITGMYAPSLGEEEGQQSGKAILALQRQGETSSGHYMENFVRALRWTGRILVDLIPSTYSAPRVLRIVGTDDQAHVVMVHGNAAGVPEQPPPGIDGIYNLGAGKFDVSVSAGPSQETKRKEAVAAMVELGKAAPQAIPLMLDVLASQMDWPKAGVLEERFKKMLPPQLQDQTGSDGQPISSKEQALMAQHEQLTQALQQATEIIQSQVIEKQTQAEEARQERLLKERIAVIQAETKTEIERAKLDADRAKTTLEAQIAQLERRFEALVAREAPPQPTAPGGATGGA